MILRFNEHYCFPYLDVKDYIKYYKLSFGHKKVFQLILASTIIIITIISIKISFPLKVVPNYCTVNGITQERMCRTDQDSWRVLSPDATLDTDAVCCHRGWDGGVEKIPSHSLQKEPTLPHTP